MAAPPVVMFLSAGRSGTDWLTSGLRALYPGIVVADEPIGALYGPRLYFRRYDRPEAVLEVPAVAAHVSSIERRREPYIETGWPLLTVLPLLARRMPDRLRIVHLTRHPVPAALAHEADDLFAGSPVRDPFTELATLAPTDANVFQPRYAEIWEQLSPYEKCLFWWTEVNMLALELPGRLEGIPFLRIQAEQLGAGDWGTLHRLLEFIRLRWHEGWRERATQALERWHQDESRDVDPLEVHRHPATIATADWLGYDLSGLHLGALLERYADPAGATAPRAGRRR